jgi:mRNA-degrading endonuclease toxin of MazEF toxin-antitoxin module
MKVKRGDVVLLDHPFSDASGSKVRPALVVQADARPPAYVTAFLKPGRALVK